MTLSRHSRGKEIVCEIGSYLGASTSAMGISVVGTDVAVLSCVDTWNNDAMSEGGRDANGAFGRNTSVVSDRIIATWEYGTGVVSPVSAPFEHLDLLFIDGDDSCEGVKTDRDAYKYLLRPGSTVAFHDYGWAEPVKRLIA